MPAPTDPAATTYGCWTTSDDPSGDEQAVLVLDRSHAVDLLAFKQICPFDRHQDAVEVVFTAPFGRVCFGGNLFADDDGWDFNEWTPLTAGDYDPSATPVVFATPVLLVLDRQGVRYRYTDNAYGTSDTRVLDWPTVLAAAAGGTHEPETG